MQDKRTYGPDQQTMVQPEKLVAAIKEALVKKGVTFTQTAGLEDTLQAALDHIDPTHELATDKASTGTTTSANSRTEVITNALSAYDAAGTVAQVTSREAFVNGALRDSKLEPLTETETLALPL